METETRELVEKLFVIFVIGPAAVYLVIRFRRRLGWFYDLCNRVRDGLLRSW